jgi:hypothetical protein
MKGSHGLAIKLLPCDHEVMGSSPGYAEEGCIRKTQSGRTLGPFPGPCISGSYLHRAALTG